MLRRIGDGIGEGEPTLPCDPPTPAELFPPGTTYTVRGRITETCGATAGLANFPVEVFARLILHEMCIPEGSPVPPDYVRLVSMGITTTDGNGNYSLAFQSDNFLPQVQPGEAGFLRALVRVRDPATGARILDAGLGVVPNAGRVFTINRAISQCLTSGTAIRVMTTSVVSGAEVFVNGVLRGVTGQGVAPGMLYVSPQLAAGDQLAARRLLWEEPSDRSAHADGSTQDWAFRVYITSTALSHDAAGDGAALAVHTVTNPSVEQVLRLDAGNPLIGFHLRASVEWDASLAQLQNYGSSLIAASDFLFNATDGQMLIERIELDDDAHFWDAADIRIYANLNQPSKAKVGGIAGAEGHMHMNPGDAMFAGVLTHEFGHYGLHVRDEYKAGDGWDDSLGNPTCTLQSGGAAGPFANGQPKDSCIMRGAWPGSATKICSNHPSNPHVAGTKQGDQACWDRLISRYADNADVERWMLRSPFDRNAVIGPLANPVGDWAAGVTLGDTSHPRLCADVILTVIRAGQPVDGAKVYLRTTYGKTVYQGTTGRRDSLGLVEGEIRVVGAHEGDHIKAYYLVFGFSRLLVDHEITASDCSAGVVRARRRRAASPEPTRLSLELEPAPFALGLTLEPGSSQESALIRIRSGAPLPDPPKCRALLGGRDPLILRPRYDRATRTYVDRVAGLSPSGVLILEAEATDAAQRQASTTTLAAFQRVSAAGAEVSSADGRLEIEIPEQLFAEPQLLMISEPLNAPPLPASWRLIGGPYSILSSPGDGLPRPVSISFQFHRSESAVEEQLRRAGTVDIVRHDRSGPRWLRLGARVLPDDRLVTAPTDAIGVFALVVTRGQSAWSQG